MEKVALSILVMAGVTYLPRMVPLVLIQKRIKSAFVRSFLYYIPYTVLAAMTFPAIFFSVGSVPAAIIGTAVAVILSYFERGLVVVAICAVLAAYLALLIL